MPNIRYQPRGVFLSATPAMMLVTDAKSFLPSTRGAR
jgi:hypothetical protein